MEWEWTAANLLSDSSSPKSSNGEILQRKNENGNCVQIDGTTNFRWEEWNFVECVLCTCTLHLWELLRNQSVNQFKMRFCSTVMCIHFPCTFPPHSQFMAIDRYYSVRTIKISAGPAARSEQCLRAVLISMLIWV